MATPEERREQNKDYLKNGAGELLHKLNVDLLIDRPEDTIEYIAQWALKMGAKTEVNVNNTTTERKVSYDKPEISSDESEDDGEEMDMNQLLEKKKKKGKTQRAGVSAEAYGRFNQKREYTPKVVPKTDEQKASINKILDKAFMFKMLEEKEKNIVLDAMEERKYVKGDYVIKQGDDGDVMYLVDTGILNCYKRFPDQPEDTYLLTYKPGMAFGELTLLYNTPRAASIIANEDSLLWSLDRECFNSIVKESSIKRRERFEKFIKQIDLLKDLDPYERNKICDVVQPKIYRDGEFVIKQGEVGTKFYFVEEGEAKATKKKTDGSDEIVFEYKENMYFGELALLKDEPRAANIIAKGDLKIVWLDREAFKRLLGPLENLLQRNTDMYDKFVKNA